MVREKFENQKVNSEISLVVVNPNVKQHLNNINFSGIHRSRRVRINSTNSYQEGQEKGRNLADIDTQMKGEN